MKCDTKTMLKVGLAVGASLAIAYFTMPDAQQLIEAASPFLLFLVCPLSMVLMMKSMNTCEKQSDVDADEAQLNK